MGKASWEGYRLQGGIRLVERRLVTQIYVGELGGTMISPGCLDVLILRTLGVAHDNFLRNAVPASLL